MIDCGCIPDWSEIDDRLFCLFCYYNAKTEIYDRKLTDKRCRYDTTSAFITPRERPYSTMYSRNLYGRIVIFASKLGIWDKCKWKLLRDKYSGTSAQGWINLYQHLDEIGKLEFIKKGSGEQE